MRKYVLPILFSTFFIGQLSAQLFTIDGRNYYFSVGVHNVDVGAFNQSLSPFGFGNLNDFNPSISGGMTVFKNNWVVGIGFESQYSGNIQNADYAMNITSGGFSIHGGYLLKQTERYTLYPTIGFGAGSTTMKIEQRNVTINNFDDVLNVRNATLDNFFISVPIAINSDFVFGPNPVKYLLGFSFGYNLVLSSQSWGLSQTVSGFNPNRRISDIAPFDPGGLFIKFKIGLQNDFYTPPNE